MVLLVQEGDVSGILERAIFGVCSVGHSELIIINVTTFPGILSCPLPSSIATLRNNSCCGSLLFLVIGRNSTSPFPFLSMVLTFPLLFLHLTISFSHSCETLF